MLCTSPVCIINPELVKNIHKYNAFHLPSGDTVLTYASRSQYSVCFPYKAFSPRITRVTSDTVDDYYFFHTLTGSVIPMYITVPCGKCALCREKKVREWQFRSLCENATSSSHPLFITLTYDNEHLPSTGVDKRSIQLFMKRLRINLTREGYSPDECNFRYFACAEYGSKTHRPHYHLIFWNFPDMKTISQRLDFISNSWKQGYAYCVLVQKGAVSYVMKYMRKDCFVPEGMNKTFFLSSRKGGGIGYKYLMERADYFYNNPSSCTVSVFDPYSNTSMESILPKFFRDRIFPSFSRVVSRTTRNVISEFRSRLQTCVYLYPAIKDYVPKIIRPFSWMAINELRNYIRNGFYIDTRTDMIPAYLKKLPMEQKIRLYEYCSRCVYMCCHYLAHETFDFKKMAVDANKREQFRLSVADKMTLLPKPDISYEIYKLNRVKRLAQFNEIF